MAERFVTFDITEVEEFIDNEESSNTRRKTKNSMVLLRSFMAKEKENSQVEEILPQELDNYLSRILGYPRCNIIYSLSLFKDFC